MRDDSHGDLSNIAFGSRRRRPSHLNNQSENKNPQRKKFVRSTKKTFETAAPSGRGQDGLSSTRPAQKDKDKNETETKKEHFDLLKKSRALSRAPMLPVTTASKAEAAGGVPMTVNDN